MLENGDHANFVFAFFRPHVTSMSVLNTHSQPQTANSRIITTNQMALRGNRYRRCRGETPIFAASVEAYFPAIRRCSMRG